MLNMPFVFIRFDFARQGACRTLSKLFRDGLHSRSPLFSSALPFGTLVGTPGSKVAEKKAFPGEKLLSALGILHLDVGDD